ncbi:PLD nuclease N-terminal domain-containing protein [Streptomyces sp. NBC_01275]|uniref:PLD nuclease N-terminal domain-containing protein n=1 Tax=Streptomyces sp. NBC_01275 TaxID=2903807 RepID=UPI00224EDB91|nr:PLD nuclease N-terminal domain-containing protein [Streptomyces sp. NBC_01275]MCX4767648.1 PLD nuclease N-terminal domain-containing protein [Streptomyces sp. NBC_01275]
MLGWAGSALAFVVALLCLYAVIDCVGTPAHRVRCGPKVLWLLLLVSAPVFGSLAWLYLGKRSEPGDLGVAGRASGALGHGS